MPLSIVYNHVAALLGRCEVADVRAVSGEPAYEDTAVIPSEPWQPLSTDTARALRPGTTAQDGTLMEVVRPPGPANMPLENLAARLGDPDAVYLGQASSKPNCLTTTDNYMDGRRIGLHLDDWDKLSYTAKHTGRRRLCLNLGPGARYLVVCELDAQTLCRAVHPCDFSNRYPHTDDLRRYVADGQSLRCLRIRLDPGDGYIAPTEYLPHDGSTQGQSEPSTAAFWLGHWPRNSLPSLI